MENVRVVIFFFVTPAYSSNGHSNMAAVGFSFPTIDTRTSHIFGIIGTYLETQFKPQTQLIQVGRALKMREIEW